MPPPSRGPTRWHPPALSPWPGTASREQPGSHKEPASSKGPWPGTPEQEGAGLGCWPHGNPTTSNCISLCKVPSHANGSSLAWPRWGLTTWPRRRDEALFSIAITNEGNKTQRKPNSRALKTFQRGDAFPCLRRAEALALPGIPLASAPSHARLSLARALCSLARTGLASTPRHNPSSPPSLCQHPQRGVTPTPGLQRGL